MYQPDFFDKTNVSPEKFYDPDTALNTAVKNLNYKIDLIKYDLKQLELISSKIKEDVNQNKKNIDSNFNELKKQIDDYINLPWYKKVFYKHFKK